jgi:hypothetical protein
VLFLHIERGNQTKAEVLKIVFKHEIKFPPFCTYVFLRAISWRIFIFTLDTQHVW